MFWGYFCIISLDVLVCCVTQNFFTFLLTWELIGRFAVWISIYY